MKAISLWQPHAGLVVLGEKKFETRSRPTNVRGRVYIHAAKKWTEGMANHYFRAKYFREAYARLFTRSCKSSGGLNFTVIPLGMLIGSVEIVSCCRVENIRDYLTEKELAFGDYSDGRYAWQLENPIIFPEPIPWKGMQGFWNMELPGEKYPDCRYWAEDHCAGINCCVVRDCKHAPAFQPWQKTNGYGHTITFLDESTPFKPEQYDAIGRMMEARHV
jgi:hypothetical protein